MNFLLELLKFDGEVCELCYLQCLQYLNLLHRQQQLHSPQAVSTETVIYHHDK